LNDPRFPELDGQNQTENDVGLSKRQKQTFSFLITGRELTFGSEL
jgi:hypothetical protein